VLRLAQKKTAEMLRIAHEKTEKDWKRLEKTEKDWKILKCPRLLPQQPGEMD